MKKTGDWAYPLFGVGVIPLISLILFFLLPPAITLRVKTDVHFFFVDDPIWADNSRNFTVVTETREHGPLALVIDVKRKRTETQRYIKPNEEKLEDGLFSPVSPDRKWEVVVSEHYTPDGPDAPTKISLISLSDGKRSSLIKGGPQFDGTERITSPMVWSPNSRLIVFRTHIGATVTHANWDKIYVVDTKERKVVLSWTLTNIERSMTFGLGLTKGQIEILSVLGLLFGPLLTLRSKSTWRGCLLSVYYVFFGVGFLCWYALMIVFSSN